MEKKERIRNSYSELPEGEDSLSGKASAVKKESWKNKENREIRILKKSKSVKERNDPDRFSGEGINFRAKIIGIENVFDARGNRMCQGALQKLKAAVKTSGDHKQRITLNISLNGIIIKEEKTGEILHHHPIHKISFISQDTKDSRAFGYVYGCPQTGHRFFAIKTEKAASQIVVTLRDLFLVALEIKKKEIEKNIDVQKESTEEETRKDEDMKNGLSNGISSSPHLFTSETEKSSESHRINHDYLYSNTVLLPDEIVPEKSESSHSEPEAASESLLDLQSEVNILQEGISQIDQSIAVTQSLGVSLSEDEVSESSTSSFPTPLQMKLDKLSSLYHETVSISSRSSSTSDYNIGISESKQEENDTPKKDPFVNAAPDASARRSSTSLSGEGSSNVSETHQTDSTATSSTEDRYAVFLDIDSLPSIFDDPSIFQLSEEKLVEGYTKQNDFSSGEISELEVKSSTPVAFAELDPLGNQPYVDKRDFFQDIKNPPKKVLKDLLITNNCPSSESYAVPNLHECLTFSEHQECTFSCGASSLPTHPPKLPPKRVADVSSNSVSSEMFQEAGFGDNPLAWECKNPFNPFLLDDYPDVPPPNSPPPPPPPRLPTKALDSSPNMSPPPPRPPSRVNGVPTPPLPRRKVPLSSANRTWCSFDQDAVPFNTGAKHTAPSLPSPVRKLPPPKQESPWTKSLSASNSPATVRRLHNKGGFIGNAVIKENVDIKSLSVHSTVIEETKENIVSSSPQKTLSRHSSIQQDAFLGATFNPFFEPSEYQDLPEKHNDSYSPPLPPKPLSIAQSTSKKAVGNSLSSSSVSAFESSISTHSSSSLVFSSSDDNKKMGSSSEALFLSSEDSQSDVFHPQSSKGTAEEKPMDTSPDSIFHRKSDPFADDFFLSLHKNSNGDAQSISSKSSPVLEVPFDNLKAHT